MNNLKDIVTTLKVLTTGTMPPKKPTTLESVFEEICPEHTIRDNPDVNDADCHPFAPRLLVYDSDGELEGRGNTPEEAMLDAILRRYQWVERDRDETRSHLRKLSVALKALNIL